MMGKSWILNLSQIAKVQTSKCLFPFSVKFVNYLMLKSFLTPAKIGVPLLLLYV